ncbi:MAG TPA: SpoIIE family protein phosphatase [Spirochaetota bacterium]|nr:SpoIIE family protein phosphatase [Spirochaetota bacterium]
MNWISIPVLMMAAVVFFVGLYYLFMFFRRKSEREQLAFAATSFVVSFYDIFSAGLYNASNISEGIFWQRLQFASLALMSITVLWFVYDFSKKKIGRVFYMIAGYFFVLMAVGLLIHNELTLSITRPMPKNISVGLIEITYFEGDPGLIYRLQYVSMMAGYVVLLYLIIKDYVSGNRKIRPLLISFIVFFAAAVNDVLVGAAVYPFVFVIEYVYLIIIISMAQMLMNRFVDMHHEIAELNRNLERKVEERTAELHNAMDSLEKSNSSLCKANKELEHAQRIAHIDMTMAANLQANLMPKEPPRSEIWDIAFACRPMAGVSGDFYDFYYQKGEMFGLSIFDVTGHGVASALLTILAKSIVTRNISAMKDANLGKIIEKANADIVAEIGSVDYFLSGIVLRFNGNWVEYVNAGHHDLLVKRDGRKPAPVRPRGVTPRGGLLGIESIEMTFDVIRFETAPGDALLLYADGFTESSNEKNETFDTDKIIRSFENSSESSALGILNYILRNFDEHMGKSQISDDCTMIVAKRK